MDITEARVRGTVRLDGRTCAEVEVLTDGPDAPGLLVYFAEKAGGGLEMVRVVENDASREIDWYDNPLHQAAVNRTDAYRSAAAAGDGGSFEERVLHFGSVREDAMRALRMPHDAHRSARPQAQRPAD
ncbi:MAG: hypothetical protein A9Z00_07225 [Thermobacillus sp. ZCTH02-B1]|uniref:hypothetical protein n=1 Tax=Thermobacillus sp. ZCTH02-B1 TaxID=1858795 RepID=UPI000B558859|nr:hypothetical protein [Thermobacillus sp. ZCTH02-B1]OUM96120.1 MAG: hypothetical protein A9Z00_07225 [Thermobacillus sp. ZCTH02-B1]